MPYFSIKTNKSIASPIHTQMLEKMSGFISELLGKPEQYVMVSLQFEVPMMFGGDTQPLAFVQLKSIGLPTEKCSDYSEQICAFMERSLNIAPDRVFIDFSPVERSLFGWNGKTF